MRKVSLAVLAALCLIASGAMAAPASLYPNSGFDDAAAAVIDATAGDVVNDTIIPGWRAVSVGGARGLFSSVVEATAPSAPNVLEITRTIDPPAGGGFWMDRWGTPVPIDNTKLFRHGASVRQISGPAGQFRLRASAFDGGGAYQDNGAGSDIAFIFPTAGVWHYWERLYRYSATAATALEMFYPETTAAVYQVDDVLLEEYPLTSQLCLNGGFEDSTALLVNWQPALTPASVDNLAGSSITTNAADVAEGSHALHIVKNPITAGDSLIRSQAIPWVQDHTAYVAYSIKNDPSIGADSRIEFLLRTFDGTAEGIAFGHLSGGAGDGSYLRREFEVPVTAAGIKTVYFDLRLRSAANEDNTPEALWVDFISLGDLTAGGVPVEMSSFDVE